MQNSNHHKPNLSRQAFWDVDMASIDYEKNARYLLEKVVERGTFQDFLELRKFYGDDRFKKEIVNATWLGEKEIYFCCAIFGLKPLDFKCYIKRLSNPELWIS